MAERDLSRRELFGLLGATGVGSLAGCSELSGLDDGGTETETVVFTDTPDGEMTDRPDDELVFDGGDAEAFSEALAELSRNPGATLEIEPGTYRFDSGRRASADYHFRPPEMTDATIEGNGATIIFTYHRAGGIRFDAGSDLTIRNLTIDYDPVPYTQAAIVDKSDDLRTLRIELDDGYPALDGPVFARHSRRSGSLHTEDGEFIRGVRKRGPPDPSYSNVTKLDDRTYELTVAESSSVRGISEAEKLIIKARRSVASLYLHRVDRPVIENVTIRASVGAGVVCRVCEEPTVRNCTVARIEDTDRLISTNADGVLIYNSISGPMIEDCRVEYTGDDAMVVTRTMTTVSRLLDERTARLDQVPSFIAGEGDVLTVFSQQGVRKGELPPITDVNPHAESDADRPRPLDATFAEPIADVLSENDVVGNTATGNHGFVIRNNEARNARGLLTRIASSHGIVEANVLDGASRNGIEIECDTNDRTFAPSGGVTDVTVRNNEISRPGLNYLAGPSPAGIRVHHRTRPGVSSTGRPNRDLTIADNEIRNAATIGIEVENAENVSVENNVMENLNNLSYPDNGRYAVRLNDVYDATVRGNSAAGTDDQLSGFGEARESANVSSSDNSLRIDGESAPSNLVSWQPLGIDFNRSVRPDGGNRLLSLRCFDLALLNEAGDVVMETNIGANESAIEFGEGVDPQEESGGESWRWFGGESAYATVSFYASHLDAATTMRLDARPIEAGISAAFEVNGEVTDEIAFEENVRRRLDISLE